MGNWHQDLVVRNVRDEELNIVAETIIDYLLKVKIISAKQAENVLGADLGYCPGEYWDFAVDYPEESHFLESLNNGVEIRKRRTVFYADGRGFESIDCPNCAENNVECAWGELFSLWINDPSSANLECKYCGVSNSISEYQFQPKWVLSNLGFVFWNWPMLSESFIDKLEKIIERKIEVVEGKL